MTQREQSLASNTVAVERLDKQVTIIVTCDTTSRAKGMYDQICAEAREGFVMLDLETVPRPTIEAVDQLRALRDE